MTEFGAGQVGDERPHGAQRLDCALALTSDADAPASCRSFVREQLIDADLAEDVLADLLLVVSELVSNAVQHGSGDPRIQLLLHTDRVRVEVGDDAVDTLPLQRAYDSAAYRGRGLMIVSALADAWGHERRGDAKWTWAELGTEGPALSAGPVG